MEKEIIQATEFDIGPLCYWDYWDSVEIETYNEYFDENNKSIKYHFSNDFEYITEIVTYYDLDKSYEELETIVKRLSDGKYFKISWFKSNYVNNNYDDKLIEVIPREITKTIYE